jgi:chemotaxis protein methyltransferase WspC
MNPEERFFSFLKDRIGLDVASVGETIVERALRQRVQATQSANSDAYWYLLQSSAEEQQALIEAVIVPETWFFRYAESFVSLAQLARARAEQLNGLRPVRILSLPCSTGEEPYSIAMTLLDAGLRPAQFTIDAMDISPLSIQRARRGVYGKNSFRSSDVSFRERYFDATGEGFELRAQVRERVDFRAGNLLDPALLARTAYDFVFCRNLLIYFDQPTQQHVFEVLKRLTRDDGVLFIGPAEGSLLTRMGMRSIGLPQTFAFSHYVQPIAGQVPAASSPSRPEPSPRAPSRPLPRTAAQPAAKPHAHATNAAAVPRNDSAATLIANIATLANEGKSADARAACERFLQAYPPEAQVFYWLGLLSEVEGGTAQAQGFYRKALYLEPQHPEALAQLAALLAAQGDSAGARRLNERAARSTDKQGSRR